MRSLFVVIPEKGHLHPVLGPAAHLENAGHEVIFHAIADLTEPLGRAGFSRFVGLGTPLDLDGPAPPKRGREFVERLADGPWLRAWIRHLLLDTVPPHVDALDPIVERLRPDVIVADPMVYAAVIVAERRRIPWVALSNSLNPLLPAADGLRSELLDTVQWLADDRDALFTRYGLRCEFSGCDALSPYATLAFATDALVGGPVPGVEAVGPSRPVRPRGDAPDFPWPWLDDDTPLVVASFGSQIYHQPDRFRALVEAVRGRDVRLILSIGDLDPAEIAVPLPDNVLAMPYIPQLELLPRTSALVTHGGANSVMEALDHGVPLLVCPVCNDQFHQVHFLERRGAGRRLDLPQDPKTVWRHLSEAVDPDGPLVRSARALGEDYRRHDGARRAAERIVGVASGGR